MCYIATAVFSLCHAGRCSRHTLRCASERELVSILLSMGRSATPKVFIRFWILSPPKMRNRLSSRDKKYLVLPGSPCLHDKNTQCCQHTRSNCQRCGFGCPPGTRSTWCCQGLLACIPSAPSGVNMLQGAVGLAKKAVMWSRRELGLGHVASSLLCVLDILMVMKTSTAYASCNVSLLAQAATGKMHCGE